MEIDTHTFILVHSARYICSTCENKINHDQTGSRAEKNKMGGISVDMGREIDKREVYETRGGTA